MRFVYISNPVGAPQTAVFRPRLGILIKALKLTVPAGSAIAFVTFNSDQLQDSFDILPTIAPFTVEDALAVASGEIYYTCVEVPGGAPVYMSIPANGLIQIMYELL